MIVRFWLGRWRLAVLVTALFAVAGIATSTQARTAADGGPGVAGQRFTGVAAVVLSPPSAVRATDGRFHIVYELVLTDMTPFAANVERVDIRDARTHRVVQSLAGRALSSRMNPVGGAPAGVKPAPTTLLGASGSAVIWLDVRVLRKADIPGRSSIWSSRPPARRRAANRSGSRAWSLALGCDPRAPLVLGPPVRRAASGSRMRDAAISTHIIVAACSPWTAPGRATTLRGRLDDARSATPGLGREPCPVVQLLQLRPAPDRRSRWNGRDRPRRRRGLTASSRSKTAAPRRAHRQRRDAARRPRRLPPLRTHETGLGPCSRWTARSPWPAVGSAG